jgi:CTP:molybdopterin cytidylyltransferase MocA
VELGARTGTAGLHVVVLAAGKATRFGSPKLLVEVGGFPMIVRATRAAMAVAGRDAVTVVLGAEAAPIAALVRRESVAVAFNPHFGEGIASSIRAGVAQLPPGTSAVLIVLADQVAVTSDDLLQLVAHWKRQSSRIVAARYRGTTGAPAIFPADLFPELVGLTGDRGARTLLTTHAARVVAVPMPSAAVDIDTPADVASGSSHAAAE